MLCEVYRYVLCFPQVRSILLRGFDQQMAEKIGTYMEDHGVKFIKGAVPTSIEKVGKTLLR